MAQLSDSFVSSGFFVLRTPLLPFAELLNWTNDLRNHLASIFAQPEMQEALFIASPSLHSSLPVWKRDPESNRGHQIEQSLVRYFLRMVGRVTPFGLFAGTSVGEIGQETHLVLEARSNYQRHTRIDMDYLCAVCERLAREPSLHDSLVHWPNSSLYRAAGRVRYVQSRTATTVRLHNLVAVESNHQLECALSLAQNGSRPKELAATLSSAMPDLSEAESKEFINELIEDGLLVPELVPAITGNEPVDGLISQLQEHSQTRELAHRLYQTQAALRRLDANGLGNSPDSYNAIARDLSEISTDVDPEKLFQVDLTKPSSHVMLGEQPLNEILKGVEIFHRFSATSSSDLSLFREVFLERYGEDNEVPLVEALDPDIGIGFSSLRQSVTSAAQAGRLLLKASETAKVWDQHDTYLLHKLEQALANGSREIVIEVRELDGLGRRNILPLPDAFAVSASLAAGSELDLLAGNFRIKIQRVSGPSGARLLGRFSHLDEELRHKVESHLREEEALNPDAIYAEIVHLPAGRTGNVLLRPVLRDYEIPYLARSGQVKEKQIPVTDLYVTVSGGRIILGSTSLRREIVPRLTASHYFPSSGPDIYRFLCSLQGQNLASEIEWDWGPLSNASFLPRVSCGRLVLSLARWNVTAKELNNLQAVERDEQFRAFQEWRAERKLPRFVSIRTGLPFDLDNKLCVESFLALSKQTEIKWLVELFPVPDELVARGPEGRYVHELVVPFVRRKELAGQVHPTSVRPRVRSKLPTGEAKRTFPPGSEWLYLKMYTGNSTADQLLQTVVQPLSKDAITAADIDCWFFIRHGDPYWHLRLRFHGPPEKLHQRLLPKLNSAVAELLSNGKIWRAQFDTYQREIERYGGDAAIQLAEKIFHVDSESILALINSLPRNGGFELRRLFAIRSVDTVMADFGLSLEAKHALAKRMREAALGESITNSDLKHQLGRKYRRERKVMESTLSVTDEVKNLFATPLFELKKGSERLSPLVAELRAREESGQLSIPILEILPHFIHMHLNRLLPSARLVEATLYDSLSRLYKSRLAQTKEPS